MNTEYGAPRGAEPLADYHRFSAAHAYDKLLTLTVIALVTGVFGYFALSTGWTYACIGVAFVLSLVATFRPRWAKAIAPAYAAIEGLALGSISSVYASFGHGIVPTAIVFTAGVFVGCLAAYRTGLVRITPRWVSMVGAGALGLTAVFVLSFLGLHIPGVSSLGPFGVVIGLFALAIGIGSLFIDFDYVNRSEAMGVNADAEWAAALYMLIALVLVYLSILRVLASIYGGGSSSSRK